MNYSILLRPARIPRNEQIGAELLMVDLSQASALQCGGRPLPCHRRNGASRHDCRNIELHAIYEPSVKGLAQNLTTAFNQHTRDLTATQLTEHIGKRFFSKDQCPLRESIGEKLRQPREFSRTRKDDSPRLPCRFVIRGPSGADYPAVTSRHR